MNKPVVLTSLVAASLIAISGCATQSTAPVAPGMESPYVLSPDGQIVKSGTGLCVRTGYWSLAAAQSYKRAGQQFPIAAANASKMAAVRGRNPPRRGFGPGVQPSRQLLIWAVEAWPRWKRPALDSTTVPAGSACAEHRVKVRLLPAISPSG